MSTFDPKLDLSIERVVRAPREAVWQAWTDPSKLQRWWVPAPTIARVEQLDIQPGGAFVTSMSDDGQTFVPHMNALFLLAEKNTRLAFTNAIDSSWRPTEPAPVLMTAEVTLLDHPEGTDYRVVVRHGTSADRDHHEELGFYDGWGSVTDALARLTEGGPGA